MKKTKVLVLFKRLLISLLIMVVSCTFMINTKENQDIRNKASATENETTEESLAEIDENLRYLENKQEELKKKIDKFKGDPEEEDKDENQEIIDEQIDLVNEILYQFDQKVQIMDYELKCISEDIDEKQKDVIREKKDIESNLKDYFKRVRLLYANSNSTYIDLFFNSKNFYDLLMRATLIKNVAIHDKKMIDDIISSYENCLDDIKELDQLKEKLESQKNEVIEQKDAQGNMGNYYKELSEMSKSRREINRINEEMQRKYEEKIKKESEKKTEKSNDDDDTEEDKLKQDSDNQDKNDYKEDKNKKSEDDNDTKEETLKQDSSNQKKNDYKEEEKDSEEDYDDGYENDEDEYEDDDDDEYYSKPQNNVKPINNNTSDYVLPCLGCYNISSPFGEVNAYHPASSPHDGVDFAASEGTPIVAVADGIVIEAKTGAVKGNKNVNQGCGNYCIIQHFDGKATIYQHAREITVRSGDRVEKGDQIGSVGETGNAYGAHLHFGLVLKWNNNWWNSERVDPISKLYPNISFNYS